MQPENTVAEKLALLHKEFCEPRQVFGLPIQLMTTTIDRWELGHKCHSGPHEYKMAMWSEAFMGGRILASYILQHPNEFCGKTLVDVGSGSGIVAIAAAKVGADVIAVDSSRYAIESILINAALNNVNVRTYHGNARELAVTDEIDMSRVDIITAADVFYMQHDSDALNSFLLEMAEAKKTVLLTSQDERLEELPLFRESAQEMATSYGFHSVCFIKLAPQSLAVRAFVQSVPKPYSYSKGLQHRFALARLQKKKPPKNNLG